MLVDDCDTESIFRMALLCGLLLVGTMALAEEDEIPNLEFLEYLGSWETSDEDWLVLADTIEPAEDSKRDKENVPAPDGEKLAEMDDEK